MKNKPKEEKMKKKWAEEIVSNNTDSFGQVDYKGIAEDVIKLAKERKEK